MLEEFLGMDFLQMTYLGNSIKQYISALGVLIGLVILFKLVQWVLLHRVKAFAKRTKTDIDDTLIEIIKGVRPRFYSFLAFWLALSWLNIDQRIQTFIDALLIIWVVVLAVRAVNILIEYIAVKKISDDEETPRGAINLIKQLVMGVLWVMGVLLILSNVGVNITSLIAGLGIGGVAVALALQNILTDLFSSFAIYFDKPFKVGDYIVVGDQDGTVEKIGIKTTRLRSLRGEEIVISNQELTSVRINNFRKLKERHVFFQVGVTYDTPQTKLEKIPEITRQVISGVKKTEFHRTHFIEFADSALVYEIVYWVKSGDFEDYRDVHEKVLLALNMAFAKEKIEFAYPTQTIVIQK
jgi:small-conductance mechanosensitive channel